MLDKIAEINSKINGFVWGIPMMILILGVGVYLSLRCGFPQFSHFGYIMKNTFGKIFEKGVMMDCVEFRKHSGGCCGAERLACWR